MHELEIDEETARGYKDVKTAPTPDLSPDNPPWSVGSAAVVWFLSVLLIVFLPLLALFPYLAVRGIRGSQAEIQSFVLGDPTAVLIQVLSVVPAHFLTLAAAWFVVTKGHKYNFFEILGWKSGGMRWWHYPVVLAAFFSLAAIVNSYFPEGETELIRILKSSKTALYSVAFLSVATAPIVEEVVYRGLLYSAIQRLTGKVFAIAVVTILFALVHVPQYYQSISTIGLLALLSLTLTVVRATTKNLLPCFILHSIFNFVQSAFLLINPEFSGSAFVSYLSPR